MSQFPKYKNKNKTKQKTAKIAVIFYNGIVRNKYQSRYTNTLQNYKTLKKCEILFYSMLPIKSCNISVVMCKLPGGAFSIRKKKIDQG